MLVDHVVSTQKYKRIRDNRRPAATSRRYCRMKGRASEETRAAHIQPLPLCRPKRSKFKQRAHPSAGLRLFDRRVHGSTLSLSHSVQVQSKICTAELQLYSLYLHSRPLTVDLTVQMSLDN
ncbi:hypothetical protein J6590_009163 [Homalodisca vitripennis]|nr:hypothetical protein J6590_009163 [Homalodisca vitripennis]